MAFLLDIAGQQKSDIVCLPEGWPTYNTHMYMNKIEANSLEGSTSKMMSEKAKKYGMYIVSGLYTWHGDTLYNCAILYNRNGDVQYIYKKVQLPDSETEEGAVPGDSISVVSTDFGKIGLLVCWDLFFPEVSRIHALKGAEILFCPIWGDNRGVDVWKVTARSRAIDNGVFLLTSAYDGKSLMNNPAGDILQESNQQSSVITAEIDLNFNPDWIWLGNKGRATWSTLWRKDRRNDLYDHLSY